MKKLLYFLLSISLFVSGQQAVSQVALPAYQGTFAGQLDADVQAYVVREAAAGYTVTFSEKAALNIFIGTLKSNGLYTKIHEMWLFIGGTAATHALGFKNVANITWVGSPTHSATGTDFNGTTQYGRTGVIPNSVLTNQTYHLSYYSGENTAYGAPEHPIGAYSGSTAYLALNLRSTADNAAFYSTTASSSPGPGSLNGSGLFVGSRTNVTASAIYRNGSIMGSVAGGSNATGTLPTLEMYIGAINNGGSVGFYTNKECRFASTGGDFTSGQVTTFSTAVNVLQTALGGRNTY
jgi:hypothetical protein